MVWGYKKRILPRDKKLKPGHILSGTSVNGDKDYFIIIDSGKPSISVIIHCLTRKIGWGKEGYWNIKPSLQALSRGYSEKLKFEIIKGATKENWKEIVGY